MVRDFICQFLAIHGWLQSDMWTSHGQSPIGLLQPSTASSNSVAQTADPYHLTLHPPVLIHSVNEHNRQIVEALEVVLSYEFIPVHCNPG